METADLHNFGQSVQKIGRGSETLFRKPRPVYWEWLFFGKKSPLSNFFGKGRSPAINPQKVIFNLATEVDADYSGVSAEVISGNTKDQLPTHLYSLGVLLGYCYVFGIRDLHRHNVIKTGTHLQVIDAEVVFSKLLLPHETLLLPFKAVGADLCGASSLLNLKASSPMKHLREIFDGYLDVFEGVIEDLDSLHAALQGLADLKTVPIRHILRDTIHYRAWKSKEPPIPFFDSEVLQLERGDIPYFFKFLDRPEVFEYTSRNGAFSPVSMPDNFLKGAGREAQSPSILLRADRVRENLLGPGLLYLAKTLLPLEQLPAIEGDGYHISLSPSEIRVSTSLGSFAAPRK